MSAQKKVGIGATIAAAFSSTKAFSQGVDFSKSGNLTDDQLFSEVRNQLMLKEGLVYLNTGTLGPAPKLVHEKITALMTRLEAWKPALVVISPMNSGSSQYFRKSSSI